ncbi:putative oxidoreductase, aryl-alcohol dehydrogenase like protein [Rivularia sp. PCC 7116]|nr:putative oxidoreductase, aryl-alcohol dehydrogenase like protein [Rivularia sp. PCC 7116]
MLNLEIKFKNQNLAYPLQYLDSLINIIMILGKATPQGTQGYKEKHQKHYDATYFRTADDLLISSIGLGTCLGKTDEQTNTLVENAVVESVRRGVNLIDTAISYRHQEGERSIGKGISQLIELQQASRDELVITSKGGILPYPKNSRRKSFYKEYVEEGKYDVQMTDLVGKRYCIHPQFIQEQLNRSLTNLGLETIDIYFIHNPERQLISMTRDKFYARLKSAFEVLEKAADAGKISAYGIATWEGFRLSPKSTLHLNLTKIKNLAKEAAGTKQDRFKFIQLPLNLAMSEALLMKNQTLDGEELTILETCDRLNILPIASKSLSQTRFVGQIPANLAKDLGENLTDCQRALQFTRSAPSLLCALVGMKTVQHIEENLMLKTIPTLDRKTFEEFLITNSQWLESIKHSRLKAILHDIKKILGLKVS